MGFNTLNIARSGLVASQVALEVTSNNIANSNTEGYTRQRVDLSGKEGLNSLAMSVGYGVEIDDISQIRDRYLDIQFRAENGMNQEYLVKSHAMNKIESIFSEPSDYGISENLTNFHTAIEQMSLNSHDLSYRETVVQSAVTLTGSFHTMAKELINYQQELDNTVSTTVEAINTKLEELQSLNDTIHKYEIRGTTANELRDERNVLVDELSGLIEINAYEDGDGKFIVEASGKKIVDGRDILKLEAVKDRTDSVTGNTLSTVYFEGTSEEVVPGSGTLQGYMEMRDGDTQEDQGVPYYLSKLDEMADDMVEEFNRINNNGWTIPYDGNSSQNGIDFFDDAKRSALEISVSDELLDSGWNIAMSDADLGDGTINWGNSSNGQEFIGLRDSQDEYYQKTISELAINTSFIAGKSSSQQGLTDFIESERLAVSEVSLDEEMVNMVQYQQSYNASAKMITVVDDMLQTLIDMVR